MSSQEWVLLIARGQFALTMGMHITLAALTLGLAPFLVWFEARWLWGRRPEAHQALHFWIKVFALTVAIGTVSGVIMEFQFGTHWSVFASKAGGIIGPLMLYEVLIAFFLESALTGVMLFGIDRVKPGVHFAITCLVALGAIFSAFWILAANSWMQTPRGFTLNDAGQFTPDSAWSLISAPSFGWRLAHMLLASWISVAFLLGGVAAWRLLRNAGEAASRLMLRSALTVSLCILPLQMVVGDLHGENTRDYQPAKLAAIEGSWQPPAPGEGEPLRLFALPDQAQQRNHAELAIPAIGSLYLRHNLSGHIKSLGEFPRDSLPPVLPVFFAFRLMVGLALLMLLSSLAGNVQRWRGRLDQSRRVLRLLALMSPAGFIALLAGWVVTEVGRQPWTVYGMLRTADSLAPMSLGSSVAIFVSVVVIYALSFAFGLCYLLRQLAAPLPDPQATAVAETIQTPA